MKRKNSNIPNLDCKSFTVVQDNNPLVEFIQQYEALPELWDCYNKFYLNKIKRNEAYLKLLMIYLKIKPNADIAAVKKKINSLRSNYRKEIRSIKRSNFIYKPKSWIFYALHQFLCNLEDHNDKDQSMEQDDHSLDESNNFYDSEDTLEFQIESVPPNLLDIKPLLPLQNETTSAPKEEPEEKLPRLPLPETSSNDEQPFESVQLEQPTRIRVRTPPSFSNCSPSSETTPIIAKVWGEKLLSLDPQQRKFAEKAINDILFEASEGTLHRNSVKIN